MSEEQAKAIRYSAKIIYKERIHTVHSDSKEGCESFVRESQRRHKDYYHTEPISIEYFEEEVG